MVGFMSNDGFPMIYAFVEFNIGWFIAVPNPYIPFDCYSTFKSQYSNTIILVHSMHPRLHRNDQHHLCLVKSTAIWKNRTPPVAKFLHDPSDMASSTGPRRPPPKQKLLTAVPVTAAMMRPFCDGLGPMNIYLAVLFHLKKTGDLWGLTVLPDK